MTPAYFVEDFPTTLDRRTQRTANAQTRKRERLVAKIKAGKGRPSRSSGPPKKKPRPKKETLRIYGPQDFRDWLHRQPCLGCGYRGPAIEQAHVQTGGMGRKSSWEKTGPLCGPHPVPFLFEGLFAGSVLTQGCHSARDHAKRSWRTQDGETFAAAQRKFFASWQKFSGARLGEEGT